MASDRYRKPQIICIDDEDPVRETLERILTEQYADQYNVSTAASGEEGLQLIDLLADAHDIAAVLCDQKMPGLDGIETLSLIRGKYPFIKRALFTAYGHDVDLVKRAISEAHVDEFIDKPIDPPEEKLFPIVERMISQFEVSLQKDKLLEEKLANEISELSTQRKSRHTIGFGDLWAFYIDANFVYNSKLSALEPVMQDVNETWRNLLTSEGDLSFTVLRYRNGVPRNSLSLIKYYPRTWIVQHMVSRRDPLGMAAVLLDSLDWMLNRSDLEYVRFFWRPNNPQPNMMFTGLSQRLQEVNAKVHIFQDFDYHVIAINDISPRLDVSGTFVRVEQAQPSMFSEICERLQFEVDPLLFQACSFGPDSLTLSSLNSHYKRYNLYRERAIFLAFCDNDIAGVAIAEFSSLGLNFSYYFNNFDIHIMKRELSVEKKKEMIHKLLFEICGFYKERGRSFVVSLTEANNIPEFGELGFAPTKRYSSMTLSKGLGGLDISYTHVEDFYRSRMMRRRKGGHGRALYDGK